jgi:triacylglycerol esterase/lipase EstA (alpha/beta hydrolase family)
MPSRSSLARLLQVACLSQIGLAIAWLAGWWATSPWPAVLGAAVIVALAPLALAAEFAVVWRFSQTDPAPKPTVAQLLRAWISETGHLFRTFYWRQPFCWRSEPDHLESACAGRTGVVLVHGFMCNRGFWNAWMRALRARGHAFVAVNLEPVYGSIDDYAAAIDDAVARVTRCTGRAPLLLCHSMGGLAARAWWRHSRGTRPVKGIATIATPHGGTWLARFSTRVNGRQMRLGSDWLRTLTADETRNALPPLTCWYTNCDNVVIPATTAVLPSADRRFVAGQAHVALAFRPEVRKAVLELLARD